MLLQNLDYASKLGAELQTLSDLDAASIMEFAREKCITQIFIGRGVYHERGPWSKIIDRLVCSAEGIDVVVYPE